MPNSDGSQKLGALANNCSRNEHHALMSRYACRKLATEVEPTKIAGSGKSKSEWRAPDELGNFGAENVAAGQTSKAQINEYE